MAHLTGLEGWQLAAVHQCHCAGLFGLAPDMLWADRKFHASSAGAV